MGRHHLAIMAGSAVLFLILLGGLPAFWIAKYGIEDPMSPERRAVHRWLDENANDPDVASYCRIKWRDTTPEGGRPLNDNLFAIHKDGHVEHIQRIGEPRTYAWHHVLRHLGFDSDRDQLP